MGTIKCTKCGGTVKKLMVFCRGAVFGWGGVGLGAFGLILPIWPLVIKFYGKCPHCGKITWLRVLKPKIFGGKERF